MKPASPKVPAGAARCANNHRCLKNCFRSIEEQCFRGFLTKRSIFLAGKLPVAFAVNEFAALVEDEVCWHGGQSTAKK